MNVKEILLATYTARIEEVSLYQLNIDNYEMALKFMDESPDSQLDEFKSQLLASIGAEKLEQKKAKVMLRVVEQRLKALET